MCAVPVQGIHSLTCACQNHTLTNVYKFCLLLNLLAACLSQRSGAECHFSSGHLWCQGGDGGSVLGRNFDTVQIHQQEVGACNETGSKMSHSCQLNMPDQNDKWYRLYVLKLQTWNWRKSVFCCIKWLNIHILLCLFYFSYSSHLWSFMLFKGEAVFLLCGFVNTLMLGMNVLEPPCVHKASQMGSILFVPVKQSQTQHSFKCHWFSRWHALGVLCSTSQRFMGYCSRDMLKRDKPWFFSSEGKKQEYSFCGVRLTRHIFYFRDPSTSGLNIYVVILKGYLVKSRKMVFFVCLFSLFLPKVTPCLALLWVMWLFT